MLKSVMPEYRHLFAEFLDSVSASVFLEKIQRVEKLRGLIICNQFGYQKKRQFKLIKNILYNIYNYILNNNFGL